MQLRSRNNVIALEYVHGAVSSNLHGGCLVNSGVNQIADGRAAEIAGREALVFVPLLARFPPKPYFNTGLVPLLAEVRRVECRAFLAKQSLEHPDEFR